MVVHSDCIYRSYRLAYHKVKPAVCVLSAALLERPREVFFHHCPPGFDVVRLVCFLLQVLVEIRDMVERKRKRWSTAISTIAPYP